MTKRRRGKDKESELPQRKPESPRLRWYCVRTRLAQERKAAVNLANQDFPVFFPLRTVTTSHGGRIRETPRPLFPRYVFVRLNVALGLHGPISGTRGVSHLLCDSSGQPHAIPDAVIEQIRKREELEKLNKGELRSGFAPGERLNLQVGPFAGFEATYLGEAKGKASLIVFIFGRETAVEVPLGRLPIGERLACVA